MTDASQTTYNVSLSHLEGARAALDAAFRHLPDDGNKHDLERRVKAADWKIERAIRYIDDLMQTVPSITCPECGRTSYNPNDIKFKFCGACDKYHDGTARKIGDHADELWKPGDPI